MSNALKELYSKIIGHPDFKEEGYLAHFFGNLRDDFKLEGSWQVGFYSSDEDLVVTYQINGKDLVVDKGRPFRKEYKQIEKLDLDLVTFTFDEMVKKVKGLQRERYHGQEPMKVIVLLQALNGRARWNVTLITPTFNTLNIKIDATSGEVISHELSSLLHWEK